MEEIFTRLFGGPKDVDSYSTNMFSRHNTNSLLAGKKTWITVDDICHAVASLLSTCYLLPYIFQINSGYLIWYYMIF